MTRSGLLLAASVALMVSCAPQLASADSIPGLRGHDHTGITVPDVKTLVEKLKTEAKVL